MACGPFRRRYGWQRDQTPDPLFTRCFHCCNIHFWMRKSYIFLYIIHIFILLLQTFSSYRWGVVVIVLEEQRDDNAGSRKMAESWSVFLFFSPLTHLFILHIPPRNSSSTHPSPIVCTCYTKCTFMYSKIRERYTSPQAWRAFVWRLYAL